MNKDFYISLIYKQLKGMISSEEQNSLQDWEAESSENQVIAEEIRAIWEASEEYDIPFELDHKTDFAKVKTQLDPIAITPKVIPIRSRRRWLNIAAAAVILLGVGFFLQNYFEKPVEWYQIAVSPETQEIMLPDGSKVWIHAKSKLSYPKNFAAGNRQIKLNGEAFFDVEKDPKNPFQVFTNNITVTVLGTEFNVKANDRENIAEVVVKEGKVKVEKKESNGSDNVTLIATEKAIYNKEKNSLEKTTDEFLNDLAWQRKSLRFQDSTLETVLSSIGELYNVDIRILHSEMKTCTLSGRYNLKTNLMKLLNNIATNFQMTISQTDHHIYEFEGGVCK